MSESLPTTEAEMLKITGVGPVKMRLYGSYFLHEIKAFKKMNAEGSSPEADSA